MFVYLKTASTIMTTTLTLRTLLAVPWNWSLKGRWNSESMYYAAFM